MNDERPTLAERFDRAGLLPHQREAAGASVVLAELLDELITETRQQSTLLRAVMARLTSIQAGQTRSAGHRAGAAAPSGTGEGDDEGGAPVLLREPGLPPADPDPGPAQPAEGGTVAGTPTTTTTAGRKPTRAAAAAKKKPPAKTATATRERGGS